MVWPFGRKRSEKTSPDPAKGTSKPNVLPGRGDEALANAAIIEQIQQWWAAQDPSPETAVAADGRLHVGTPPDRRVAPDAPAGAVLRAKRGKLAWVDLYDPELRTSIDTLVKHLDRHQRWYFNGVIATKYDEAAHAQLKRGR